MIVFFDPWERFFKIQNFVSKVEVTIAFEKLTNEPYKFEEKVLMLFWKAVKIEKCAARHVHSQGLCYMWIQVERSVKNIFF